MAQNILELIKQDHKKTLSELEGLTSSESGRDQKYSSMKKELIAHMNAEESTLYPQLEKSIRMKVLEAIEEHNTVKMVMEQMDSMSSSDDRWLAKLMVVQENVKHHIQEEEGEIFKEAQEKFSNDQLSDMGSKFQDAKGMMPSMAR
jgi:hemerythrin-like domain-containing protein